MVRLDTFNRLTKISINRNISRFEKISLIMDVFWERLRYGTEIQDYFQYEFFKLKNRERRNYMTFTRLRETMRICNNPSKREVFDDKALFNSTFEEFICRDWLDVTTASYIEFKAFLQKHNSFFAKAKIGMFGKNAGRFDVGAHSTETETKSLFCKLKENGCIIEQLINQHPELEKLNRSSVNTLRVVTLRCADGNPKVMAGVLRMGRAGETADNFHHYGIAATFDVENGVVNSQGIDREFKRYLIHPDSGERIIGYEIPLWRKVKDIVIRCAMVVPDVRYVGWDVAIDAEGNVLLIEGNYGADPDVTQMPCRTGNWRLYEHELKKIDRIT